MQQVVYLPMNSGPEQVKPSHMSYVLRVVKKALKRCEIRAEVRLRKECADYYLPWTHIIHESFFQELELSSSNWTLLSLEEMKIEFVRQLPLGTFQL